MPATISPADPAAQHTDVQQLLDGLRQLRQCQEPNSEDAKKLRHALIELLYEFVHRALRPALLRRYGRTVGETAGSDRFTALLNDVFVRVLEKIRKAEQTGGSEAFPRGLLYAETAAGLRRYVEQALVHEFIDHLRRRGRGEKVDADFDLFLKEREEFFQKYNPELSYSSDLGELKDWAESDDAELQQHAAILQMVFVACMNSHEIMAELDISKNVYYERYKAAINRLRQVMLA